MVIFLRIKGRSLVKRQFSSVRIKAPSWIDDGARLGIGLIQICISGLPHVKYKVRHYACLISAY